MTFGEVSGSVLKAWNVMTDSDVRILQIERIEVELEIAAA